MSERDQLHQIYIRVCRDSGFRLEWTQAAKLTANMLGITPMQVWAAFPSADGMKDIAAGTHPVLEHPRYKPVSPPQES